MNTSYRHALSGMALALFTVTVSAAPIALDTEQKAAAGVSAAFFTSHEVPLYVHVTIEAVRRHTDRALESVAAITTPEALMATRGSITIPCAMAGTLTARMANALPRVLKLEWNGCVMDVDGWQRTYNGPAAITLTSDSFEPETLQSIRFGNAAGDFTEQYRIETAEQIDTVTNSIDLVVRGDISMTRTFGGFGDVIGTSSYEMRGHMDDHRLLEFPDGSPSYENTVKIVLQRLTAIESTTVSDTGTLYDDDLQLLSGALTILQSQPAPYGDTTQAYTFNAYQVRKITDWDAFSSQLFVNGRVNVTWNPFFGSGCTDGVYAFRTREPLVSSLATGQLESGNLTVNGDVVARFFFAATVPPQLPMPVNGMLVNMRVKNVGTFNYDAASAHEALYPIGQCAL